MACIAHPPAEVAAVIAAAPTSTKRPLEVRATGRSARYIAGNGDMDFTCFHHPIRVRLRIRSSHVYFSWRHPMSFAYDQRKEKQPVTPRVRQFPGGIHHSGRRTIWFTYDNGWDCGVGDNVKRCPVSKYGLYLVDIDGRVRHFDPIIGNGGHSSY